MPAINRIYFMFHPVCWAIAMTNGEPPATANRESFLAIYEWEKQVNQRQKEFFSNMASDEALVIFPISDKPPMVELEQHAERALGDRCIVVRRECPRLPVEWNTNPNVIERFLDDDQLEGKSEFLRDFSSEQRAEVMSEIREAVKVRGSSWSAQVLKVIIFNKLSAMDLLAEFKNRGLEFDPAAVECESFGEGFEQCAMTWKSMLVPYMGIANPAYNIFALSVTGAPFLREAKFKERVKLTNEIQLHLWETDDGRFVGFYSRAWCRLKDPQFFALIDSNGLSHELWGITSLLDSDKYTAANGALRVPVHNAIRRDSTDETVYIVASDIDYQTFRQRLVNASI